ncbi:immunoglobulin lambda-1 light chain-like [Spea bombifrons]|uniref:immunoglobulin lambda-1 light chain-like n=1 Tax=Spea bombifrons TaxID=233779 RepID=UPI0023497D2F|nr:immunoglobulin lambda-1 light chain-like [Spea bombifrons]
MDLAFTYFLMLLLWIPYVMSQTPVLTPAFQSVNKEQVARITCNVGIKEGYAIYFLRQLPGGIPQMILYHHHSYPSPKYGPGISSTHYTSTVNSAGTEYEFIINNVQSTDTCLYYCSKWYTSISVLVFSQSSKLVVTVDKFPEPAVMVFKPYTEELSPEEKPILTCHISKLSVSLANVKWLVDGTTVQDGVSTSLPIKESDNTYSMSSYLTIPSSDVNKDKIYSCWIQQEGSSAFTSQGIKLSQCKFTASC